MKILILDYGMGNLRSVFNAIQELGETALISSNPEDLSGADAFVMPGVGAFPQAMVNLDDRGLVHPLREQILGQKKPLLAICLGMQILGEDSVEMGINKGLGWVPGHVRSMEGSAELRLPHVGWNTVRAVGDHFLFRGIRSDSSFYFDHSYHLVCEDGHVAARSEYGVSIAAAVQFGNIMATQFHPEKSQDNGMRVLRNFLNWAHSPC